MLQFFKLPLQIAIQDKLSQFACQWACASRMGQYPVRLWYFRFLGFVLAAEVSPDEPSVVPHEYDFRDSAARERSHANPLAAIVPCAVSTQHGEA
jgi:hypothetical protein